jgi:hypothetical protein
VEYGDVFVKRAMLILLLVGTGACGGRAGAASAQVPPAKPAKTAEPVAPEPPGVMIDLPPPEDPAPVEAACLAGDANACERAARLYYDGWGVPRDRRLMAMYSGLVRTLGGYDLDLLYDIAYLAPNAPRAYFKATSVEQYQIFVVDGSHRAESPWCVEHPDLRNEWGWAAYALSTCDGEGPIVDGYREADRGYFRIIPACLGEGDVRACRGWWMANFEGRSSGDEDIHLRFKSLCREQGALCDVAIGDTDEETAQFREKGCRGRSYSACKEWIDLAHKVGRPYAPLVTDRIWAHYCLHPEGTDHVPLSVGRQPFDEFYGWCDRDRFHDLLASTDPADRALLRALSHKAEPMHASDCTGRFYDLATCSQFVFGFDARNWGVLELPEAQLWKERLAAREHMCSIPLPDSAPKGDLERACGKWNRDQVDEAYKKFLAQEAWQKAHR